MNSHHLLLATLLFAPVAASRAADAPERKPNVIFILTDDQGPWALGCAGNPEIARPTSTGSPPKASVSTGSSARRLSARRRGPA